VLQCVAACCSVLQRVAVCCSVLQCVAVCCSVLQCVAVCCSVYFQTISTCQLCTLTELTFENVRLTFEKIQFKGSIRVSRKASSKSRRYNPCTWYRVARKHSLSFYVFFCKTVINDGALLRKWHTDKVSNASFLSKSALQWVYMVQGGEDA